jgi:hypothetical protein
VILILSAALRTSAAYDIDFKTLLQNLSFPGTNYQMKAVAAANLK